MDTLKAITKSRVNLVLDEPFFGTLALRLKVKLEPGIETACTDGHSIIFDPAFIETLSEQQLNTVIAHEVMHCALLHHARLGNRNPQLANMAADHVVNLALQEAIDGGAKAFHWPSNPVPLKDARFKGKSFEEVYRILYAEQPPPNKGDKGKGKPGDGNGQDDGQESNPDPGGMGSVKQPKPEQGTGKDGQPTPQEIKKAIQDSKDDWESALVQAAQAAKMQGKLPAGMEQLVNGLLNPKVPWQTVLREFVNVASKDDWSWMRPNRRMLSLGHYLPGLHSQRCGHIVVAVDTSGSCMSEVPQFMGECQAILDEVRPDKLTVMDIDAAVGNVREYSPGDILETDFKGCGGTDFRPAFEHIAKEGLDPVCMVYLTDLYGTFPKEAPDYPVLWIATSDQAIPWGEVVRIV